jgi:putative ABC transport system substrate-binding protein
MKRRDFLSAFAGATVWSNTAYAQQTATALPVVAFLASSSADAPSGPIEGIHVGLREGGFEIGRGVRIEYRYANNRLDQLPSLAAELVTIPAAVIITTGGPATTLAVKRVTTKIPIVFAPVSDPVSNGLVASLNHPGGNITGVAALTIELDPKRLELLHEMTTSHGPLGVLLNPTRPDTEAQVESIKAAAQSAGRELVLGYARALEEIESAFAMFAQRPIVGLLVGADPFFSSRRGEIVTHANRGGWPAIYQWREFAEAGGLATFGTNLFEAYRQVGLFAARILRGENPADLPVLVPTKYELVVNLRTAKALGLKIPPQLLARADEVIE